MLVHKTQHIIQIRSKSLVFFKLPLLTDKIKLQKYKNVIDLNASYFRLCHVQYQAPYKYSEFIQLP